MLGRAVDKHYLLFTGTAPLRASRRRMSGRRAAARCDHRASCSPAARARRMGGVDKGLQPLRGKPMVAVGARAPRAAGRRGARSTPTRTSTRYARVRPPRRAPTRSAASPARSPACTRAWPQRRTRWSSPCPATRRSCRATSSRACAQRSSATRDLAVAKTGDQPHPVFCAGARVGAARTSRRSSRAAAARSTRGTRRCKVVEVPFDDEADAFRNINTRDGARGARGAHGGRIDDPARADRQLPRRLRSRTRCRSTRARGASCAVPHAGARHRARRDARGARAACSPRTSSRRSTCPRTTTRRWTAGRCAARDLAPDGDDDAAPRSAPPTPARAFDGDVGAGQCVRIMTGAVMPRGRRHRRDPGSREGRRRRASSCRRARRPGRTVRFAGEDLAAGVPVLHAGQAGARRRPRPDRLARHRARSRCSAGCASRSSPPATSSPRSARRSSEGEVYDSNRYTLYGMLARLGVEIIDMGVVRDDPAGAGERVPRSRGERRRA